MSDPRSGKLRPVISILAGAVLICCLVQAAAAAAQTPARSKIPYSTQELFALGGQRVYEGPDLKEIAFPLGGIGTGTVSLGGRGNLRDWEVFNRPGKGVNLPFTFFALYFKDEDGRSAVRVLEGPLTPPYTGRDGIKRTEVPGLPRMERARFYGEYPFARVEMTDSRLPLSVSLEAFNPFIPLDPEASGIPAAVLRFRIRNLSARPVTLTVAGSIMNPVGFDGEGEVNGLGHDKFGHNLNAVRKTPPLSGLFMTSSKPDAKSTGFGTVALATPLPDITYVSHWERGDWWDDLQIFWDDFSKDGRLKDLDDGSPSPDKQTDVGSLGVTASLDPFEEVSLPFVLAWHFPNYKDYFDVVAKQQGGMFRNQYAARFADAWAAADYLVQNLPELERRTRLFHDALFSSTLPPYVIDAVSSQMSIIRTTTCLWLEGQGFFGFEGCNDKTGCCPLNCAHVWNYEQSLAFLFPSLERSMRETDFLNQVKPDGGMVFRTSLPLNSGLRWDFKPAADGQMGRIISLFRDWQFSGDNEFLRKLWPDAKRALEYAWTSWDADRDGLMEGEQHNTYDIEFYGPNSMMGGFYLGALLAGSKMAAAMGDQEASARYLEVFEKGKQKYDDLLWNGEYYVQKYDQVMEKKYQYGDGCLSDQALGQWMSMVAGLGRFLPEDRLKSALGSIFRYNFKTDFRDFSNVQRTYALNDEKGLLLCSWPKGGRPPLPFVYSDEVWTGIEYHVASHLLYEGLLEEGLSIVKGVRDRYDGRRRNPWDEVECGHHYARAMSSWGLLLALSGFSYSGVDMKLGFEPQLYPENFSTLWTTGSGWGSFSQMLQDGKTLTMKLSAAEGELRLKEVFFLPPPACAERDVKELSGSLGKSKFSPVPARNQGHLVFKWDKPVIVKPDQDLTLVAKF